MSNTITCDNKVHDVVQHLAKNQGAPQTFHEDKNHLKLVVEGDVTVFSDRAVIEHLHFCNMACLVDYANRHAEDRYLVYDF